MVTHSDYICAQKLKALIQKNNLVQKQVAVKTGLHQQVISELVRGNKPFTRQIIQAVSQAFGIAPSEFDSPTDTVQENFIKQDVHRDYLVQNLLQSKDETIKVLQQTILSKDEAMMTLLKNEKLLIKQIKDLKGKINLLTDRLNIIKADMIK